MAASYKIDYHIGQKSRPCDGESHGSLAHSQEAGLLLLYKLVVTADKHMYGFHDNR